MRWPAAFFVLLLVCALSKWLLATDIQIQDPSLAGMPLSGAEYDHFFKTLNSPHRVSAVCFLRAMYGCQNALIQTLDLYENHGIVPEGRVCSDLAEMPTFPDFCTLTFYRCTLKKYFVKRVQCPDEINEMAATTQNTNQEPGTTKSPSTLQEAPLTSILPTILPTTGTSPALLTSASNTPTSPPEAITTAVSAVTSSMKPLLALDPIPTTTDSESLLELLTGLDAVIAEQSFPELFTTNDATPTTEESFPQDLPVSAAMPSLSPVPMLPSTSHATSSTPVTSVSTVTVSSSEPATTEAATSPMGTTPTMTDESSSQHVTVLAAVPSPSPAPTLPSTSYATSATPVTSESTVTVSSSEPATTEVATSPMGSTPTKMDESSSQDVTVLAAVPSPSSAPTLPSISHAMTAAPVTSVSTVTVSSSEPATTEAATPSTGSIPTNPATTVAPASSLTSEPPSPIIPAATASLATSSNQPCSVPPFSSSTASKLSVLSMKPTTPKNHAHLSPPASVAHWPVVPISDVLGQYPLRPTPVMQLFILPSVFGPRKLKPQGAIAISPLLPIVAGPANIWQKKKIPEPQMNTPATAKLENFLRMNSPTTANLENFFLRLKDGRVQQLMQKMRALMAKGKAVKKQLLQSTSLQLLSALKRAKQKKSMLSLVPKNQLQR